MTDEFGAVVDLLSHPGFLTGLGIGLVAAAMLLAPTLGRSITPFGWGLAFAATVLLGLSIHFDVDPKIFLFLGGSALVGVAGDVISANMDGSRGGTASTIGNWFAALVGTFGLTYLLQWEELAWVSWALPLTMASAGVGIWLLSRSDVSEAVGPMVAISVAGMWVTVPETDMITVLVGAAIPFGIATLPPFRARPWMAGSLVLSGTMAWLVLIEGVARPWTIAAAWATLATLLILGVLVRSRPGNHNPYLVLGIHVAYVVLVTRIADITDSVSTVALATIVLVGLSGVAASLLSRLYTPAELRS